MSSTRDRCRPALCTLALTHLADPSRAIAELARVVRPGGRVITSDSHPFLNAITFHAAFPTSPNEMWMVRNHAHWPSTYVRAFAATGLHVARCLEPRWTDRELALERWADASAPGLTSAALGGLPLLIIWEGVKPQD